MLRGGYILQLCKIQNIICSPICDDSSDVTLITVPDIVLKGHCFQFKGGYTLLR